MTVGCIIRGLIEGYTKFVVGFMIYNTVLNFDMLTFWHVDKVDMSDMEKIAANNHKTRKSKGKKNDSSLQKFNEEWKTKISNSEHERVNFNEQFTKRFVDNTIDTYFDKQGINKRNLHLIILFTIYNNVLRMQLLFVLICNCIARRIITLSYNSILLRFAYQARFLFHL